jgi:hypothetical protein
MPTVVAQAVASMFAAIRAVNGRATVYRRGETTLDAVTAVPSEARTQIIDPVSRTQVEVQVRDYLIAADQLAALTPAEPAEGDQVEDTDLQGVTRVYEVLSPGGDEPAWRWADPDHRHVRLHTKLIAETTEP